MKISKVKGKKKPPEKGKPKAKGKRGGEQPEKRPPPKKGPVRGRPSGEDELYLETMQRTADADVEKEISKCGITIAGAEAKMNGDKKVLLARRERGLAGNKVKEAEAKYMKVIEREEDRRRHCQEVLLRRGLPGHATELDQLPLPGVEEEAADVREQPEGEPPSDGQASFEDMTGPETKAKGPKK